MAEVSLTGVTKRFGADVALDDVTMTIPHGSLLFFWGRPGLEKPQRFGWFRGLISLMPGKS